MQPLPSLAQSLPKRGICCGAMSGRSAGELGCDPTQKASGSNFTHIGWPLRSPAHCIEYVKLIQWEHEREDQCEFDADNEEHMAWVYEKALERAKSFGIEARHLRRSLSPGSGPSSGSILPSLTVGML